MLTFDDVVTHKAKVAVVGLGYVGLPLAVALAKHFDVLGFDISQHRVDELKKGHDRTGEVEETSLRTTTLKLTADPAHLKDCQVIIIAVPTPIDAHNNPDLKPIEGATKTVSAHLQRGAIVVYESTVYPGVTEEVCVPLIESVSGLTFQKDFEVGYSPERINPGDKIHTVDKIIKVVSASSPQACDVLSGIYGACTTAGIHKASSIKVAEAAKVIENTQRDLNIALMNELALIFDKLGIDTQEVLEAAGTKWNFLPFRPGLVGGHCIGVDPYYLTYRAEAAGYHPEVILSGRRINDGMGKYIAEKCLKMLIKGGSKVAGARVGIFGLTFKENVPDLRNTRVVDIYRELREYGVDVLVSDPLVESEEALQEYGIPLHGLDAMHNLDAIIFAVCHDAFTRIPLEALSAMFAAEQSKILLDIKGIWQPAVLEEAGFISWRL